MSVHYLKQENWTGAYLCQGPTPYKCNDKISFKKFLDPERDLDHHQN